METRSNESSTKSATAKKYRDESEVAETKAVFLAELSIDGNVSRAARKAEIDRVQIYRWKDADAKFSKDWDEHKRIGDHALEDEATRRAYEGIDVPVTIAGEREVIKRYSDSLLMFRLKGIFPEKYRDNQPQVNVEANMVDQSRPYASLVERIRARRAAKEAAEQGNGKYIENGKHEG